MKLWSDFYTTYTNALSRLAKKFWQPAQRWRKDGKGEDWNLPMYTVSHHGGNETLNMNTQHTHTLTGVENQACRWTLSHSHSKQNALTYSPGFNSHCYVLFTTSLKTTSLFPIPTSTTTNHTNKASKPAKTDLQLLWTFLRLFSSV